MREPSAAGSVVDLGFDNFAYRARFPAMKYTKLGGTGLTVSRLCLGCGSYGIKSWQPWVLEEADAREHYAHALESGINFFDTADMYSNGVSEQITGRYLREMGRREELVVATKVGGAMGSGPNCSGLGRKHIIDSCDASLRRLGMDYIDLYQIHNWDTSTPMEETLEALDSVVRAGKVRFLGVSNTSAWMLAKALFTARAHGWHRFVSVQNHYTLIYREDEREVIPLCIDQGVGLIPWRPLARGFLTSNRDRSGKALRLRAESDPLAESYRPDDYDMVDAVAKIAAAHGVGPAVVALAWLLQAPGMTAPIIGVTKKTHIEDAVKAVDFQLTREEVAALQEPHQPHEDAMQIIHRNAMRFLNRGAGAAAR
jgi:aryl-alcohol dehydrogenase-like predicted oxidoreductase